MAFPPLKNILVMYVVAVGLLWTSTRILAPAGEKPSILRCLGAAVLMTFFGNASRHFLAPLIGDWYVLVLLLAYIVVPKAVFKLALWRSVLVALIYFAGVLVVYYFLFARTAQ